MALKEVRAELVEKLHGVAASAARLAFEDPKRYGVFQPFAECLWDIAAELEADAQAEDRARTMMARGVEAAQALGFDDRGEDT